MTKLIGIGVGVMIFVVTFVAGVIDYGVGFPENGSREALGYCMTIDYQTVTINSPRERAYDDQVIGTT